MIGRRSVLAGLGAVLGALPADAQDAAAVRRIGVLRPGGRPNDNDPQFTHFPHALARLGYVEGRNLRIGYRFAEGRSERMSALARELLDDGAELIVAVGPSSVQAARGVSGSVPIVMFANVDPLALGLVASLARPGGNVTGVLLAPEGTLAAKRVALLKEAAPNARRLALLAPEGELGFDHQMRETLVAAAAAGVPMAVVVVRGDDYGAAFAEVASGGAEALIVGSHQYFVRDRAEIIALAASRRLPAIYEWAEQVRDGGMLSYGANLAERYGALAGYIDKLLRGSRPSDLPIEQPSTFFTTVNMRTVRALGLELPLSFLARVDEVIE